MRAKKIKVFHRVFLGAHRYTTKGSTARPAGSVLRTAWAKPSGRVLTQRQKERAVYGN